MMCQIRVTKGHGAVVSVGSKKEFDFYVCVCVFFNVKVNCACVTGSLLFMTKNSTLTKNTLTVIYIKGVLNIF